MLVSVHLEIVLILTQGTCAVWSNVPLARKSCWTHPMEHLGEWVLWNLIYVHLETMLLSMQYNSRVCAERIAGLEFVLDAPDDTPR
jgi:hypothetical protein